MSENRYLVYFFALQAQRYFSTAVKNTVYSANVQHNPSTTLLKSQIGLVVYVYKLSLATLQLSPYMVKSHKIEVLNSSYFKQLTNNG